MAGAKAMTRQADPTIAYTDVRFHSKLHRLSGFSQQGTILGTADLGGRPGGVYDHGAAVLPPSALLPPWPPGSLLLSYHKKSKMSCAATIFGNLADAMSGCAEFRRASHRRARQPCVSLRPKGLTQRRNLLLAHIADHRYYRQCREYLFRYN